MGFGPASSDSTTKISQDYSQLGASDQAQVIQTKGRGRTQTGGTNVTLGRGAALSTNITTADPDLLKNALDSYGRQTDTFASTLQDILRHQSAASSDTSSTTNAILSKLGDLASATQTGGASLVNKTLLWIGLGALVVVGLWLWKK